MFKQRANGAAGSLCGRVGLKKVNKQEVADNTQTHNSTAAAAQYETQSLREQGDVSDLSFTLTCCMNHISRNKNMSKEAFYICRRLLTRPGFIRQTFESVHENRASQEHSGVEHKTWA